MWGEIKKLSAQTGTTDENKISNYKNNQELNLGDNMRMYFACCHSDSELCRCIMQKQLLQCGMWDSMFACLFVSYGPLTARVI